MASAADRAFDLFGEKLYGKGEGFRFYGIPEIDDVRSVDDDLIDPVCLHILPGRGDVEFADGFPPGVLGRSGIEHKSICAVGDCLPGGAEKHLSAAHAYV